MLFFLGCKNIDDIYLLLECEVFFIIFFVINFNNFLFRVIVFVELSLVFFIEYWIGIEVNFNEYFLIVLRMYLLCVIVFYIDRNWLICLVCWMLFIFFIFGGIWVFCCSFFLFCDCCGGSFGCNVLVGNVGVFFLKN